MGKERGVDGGGKGVWLHAIFKCYVLGHYRYQLSKYLEQEMEYGPT